MTTYRGAIPCTTLGLVSAPSAGDGAADLFRSDSLAEFHDFTDDGCDLHPKCLTCPFVKCRYEVGGGIPALMRSDRDQAIQEAHQAGESVSALAARFGLSRRTVFRVLSADS